MTWRLWNCGRATAQAGNASWISQHSFSKGPNCFMSTKPDGPCKTGDSGLKQIYTIPSSYPVYKVTYVTKTNATATTVESSSGCATTSQAHNPYAQWGSSVATPNGQAIQTGPGR